MKICQKETWNGRCCCNCKYHLQDHSISYESWVCAPGFERAYSDWDEHGMCEYWEKKDQ